MPRLGRERRVLLRDHRRPLACSRSGGLGVHVPLLRHRLLLLQGFVRHPQRVPGLVRLLRSQHAGSLRLVDFAQPVLKVLKPQRFLLRDVLRLLPLFQLGLLGLLLHPHFAADRLAVEVRLGLQHRPVGLELKVL